jgi:hypothetical protein
MKALKSRYVTYHSASGQGAASRCRHEEHAFGLGPVRTVLDDSGTLAIKAWTCAKCGGLMEEIQILSRPSFLKPVASRYVQTTKAAREPGATAMIQR